MVQNSELFSPVGLLVGQLVCAGTVAALGALEQPCGDSCFEDYDDRRVSLAKAEAGLPSSFQSAAN